MYFSLRINPNSSFKKALNLTVKPQIVVTVFELVIEFVCFVLFLCVGVCVCV